MNYPNIFNCNLFVRYAIKDSNINDINYDKLNDDIIPDIILVKKFYGHDKSARRRARMWKLKRLADDIVSISTENKYDNSYLPFYKICLVFCSSAMPAFFFQRV